MPKRRYEHRELTYEWQQIQPLLKDSVQVHYEIIRPVLSWGVTPKERGEATGVSPRTIYYQSNLFDQVGMDSLLPAEPPPPVSKLNKWMKNYNFQRHMAHEQRDDGCHSPAAVLGWFRGMQPELTLIHRVFSVICETSRLNRAGYAKFRNFLLHSERNLAGEKTVVNIFQATLTLEYEEEPLSRYSVEWQPDERHLVRVGKPRLFNHFYQSQQLPPWTPGEVEWYLIKRTDPPAHRRKHKGRVCVIQPPFLLENDGTRNR